MDFMLQLLGPGIHGLVKRIGLPVWTSNQRNNRLIHDHRSEPALGIKQLFNDILRGEQEQVEVLFSVSRIIRKIKGQREHRHRLPGIDLLIVAVLFKFLEQLAFGVMPLIRFDQGKGTHLSNMLVYLCFKLRFGLKETVIFFAD
ncbi:hypothetical protein D3C74_297000 [compost metagenome]